MVQGVPLHRDKTGGRIVSVTESDVRLAKDIALVVIAVVSWMIAFARAWDKNAFRLQWLEKELTEFAEVVTEVKNRLLDLTVQIVAIEERVESLTADKPRTTRRRRSK